MAAAVEATYAFTLNVRETIALALDNVTDPTIDRTIGANSATLNSGTTPAVTKTFDDTIALVAGAAVLDLTALTDAMGIAKTFTGLKIQLVKLHCPSTNTVGIVVSAKDDATGYCLFGVSAAELTYKVQVMPGATVMLYHDDESADVDATHKDLTFTGAGVETIQVQLVAG
jgi:hypothetical protein